MKKKKILQALAFLLTAIIATSLAAPASAKAEQFRETCVAEEEIENTLYGEQRFYIIDVSGAVTEYVYNCKGLLVEETDPLGAVTTYEYDSADRVSKMTTPDGTVTEYVYTAEGNVAKITARKITGETETLQYLYAPDGSLVTASTGTTMDEYTYTAHGAVASVTRNGKYRLELGYDANGNLIELKELRCGMTAADSVTTYAYDAYDRLVKATQDGTLLAEYSYTVNGKIKQQVDGAGNITEYTYDDMENLASMETKTATDIVLYREENSYNDNGSVTTRVVSGVVPEATGAEGAFHYIYDESDRLLKEEGTYGTICYTYDSMGNRLTKTENGVTTYYTYDLCNKLLSETVNGAVTSYVYDAMGNLVKKTGTEGTTSYIYNAFNQLEKVTNPYGICQENSYDAFGIRSALMENGVTTEYMTYNGMVLAGYNKSGERTEHYSYGNKILTREAYLTEDTNPFLYSGEQYDETSDLSWRHLE